MSKVKSSENTKLNQPGNGKCTKIQNSRDTNKKNKNLEAIYCN